MVRGERICGAVSAVRVGDAPEEVRFTFPIRVGGIEVMALLDTGADVSCMSTDFVRELGAATFPASGEISLAVKGVQVSVFDRTEDVSVQFVGRAGVQEVATSFIVFREVLAVPVIVGLDLMPMFGVAVSNLPTAFPSGGAHGLPEDVPEVPDRVELPPSPQLASELEEGLRDVLIKNRATRGKFCSWPEALVTIETGEARPKFTRQYPLPSAYNEAVTKQVQAWVDSGVVALAPKGCAWNSSLVCVRQGVKLRVCLDLRAINNMIPSDMHPLPLIDEVLREMSTSSMFSALDLEQSYNQFPVAERDREKTAFTWGGQHLMFCGAPFGLKPLSSVFQRVMSRIFRGEPSISPFIDDVLVGTAGTQLEHMCVVRNAVELLTEANLTLNVAKCKFGYRALRALGHYVSPWGVSVDAAKMPDLLEFPVPKTGTEVQSFLGLVNYFR